MKRIFIYAMIGIGLTSISYGCYVKNQSTRSDGSFVGTCSNNNQSVACSSDKIPTGETKWGCHGPRGHSWGWSPQEAIEKVCGC